MYLHAKHLYFFLILLCSCQTGKLKVIGNIAGSIKESSAVETISSSNLIWTIEDAGNKSMLYGLNTNGKIIKNITITNSKNIDWEDLTSDSLNNLYIGDFGNNNLKRHAFTIYKVLKPETVTDIKTEAGYINFSLPKTRKPKDFEAFFLWEDYFYVFSKQKKKTDVFKVPNAIGSHVAEFVCAIKLKGKKSQVTSVDFNEEKREILLLNHDKVIRINAFENDGFSKGNITYIAFEHDSQKEGICYKDNNTIVITDEYSNNSGGNIYEFKLD